MRFFIRENVQVSTVALYLYLYMMECAARYPLVMNQYKAFMPYFLHDTQTIITFPLQYIKKKYYEENNYHVIEEIFHISHIKRKMKISRVLQLLKLKLTDLVHNIEI